MAVSEEVVAATFKLVEDAALAGERAPQTQPHGPLSQAALTELYRRGMLRSEVFAKNWRRFTLLVGPNKGRATKDCPMASARPYKVINGAGATRAEAPVQRAAPSAPRSLTRDELDRLWGAVTD